MADVGCIGLFILKKFDNFKRSSAPKINIYRFDKFLPTIRTKFLDFNGDPPTLIYRLRQGICYFYDTYTGTFSERHSKKKVVQLKQ